MGEIKRCTTCESGNIVGGTEKCKDCKRDPMLVDNWELREPKTMKKTFVIEYVKNTIFGEKYMRDSLNYRIMGDPFIEVNEIENPRVPLPKFEDHGNDDLQATGNYEDIYDIAAKMIKKSEEPEIVEKCDTCGWHESNGCINTKSCDLNYNEWKPIEKKEND